MLSWLRRRSSPALVISLIALFFAVGGSAFAVGERKGSQDAASPFQRRCQTGALKGIVFVTGDPTKGLENLPEAYTASPTVFGARWSCTGGGIQVRRAGPSFDVRFVNNSAGSAVATPLGGTPAALAVARQADGAFRVRMQGSGPGGAYQNRQDIPFVLVAF